MEKIKILVCAHKKDAYTRNSGIYSAIQVGKDMYPDVDLGYINDNSGENISALNPKYCEWTALYWGWKNLQNIEYVGLCHYRRYFDIEITESNIDKIMKSYDILITKERISSICNFDIFHSCVGIENAFLLVDTVLSVYPDSYQSLVDYLLNSNHYTLCSMFLAKKEIYDDCCNFIFKILFEYEKRIKDMPYSRMNRAIAYAGELLLGFYIRYRGLRPKIVPMKTYGNDVSSFQMGLIDKILTQMS
ncbi:MAG: DUF4422 domain-containing protein, partial [Aeriscardovia sp.]|nr:DUF4422 domain-containing protein [Aeriscardovia sp.]